MELRERETRAIRAWAETIRSDLKTYKARGGSLESFLPRVRRAGRQVRQGELERALRTLILVDNDVRTRIVKKQP